MYNTTSSYKFTFTFVLFRIYVTLGLPIKRTINLISLCQAIKNAHGWLMTYIYLKSRHFLFFSYRYLARSKVRRSINKNFNHVEIILVTDRPPYLINCSFRPSLNLPRPSSSFSFSFSCVCIQTSKEKHVDLEDKRSTLRFKWHSNKTDTFSRISVITWRRIIQKYFISKYLTSKFVIERLSPIESMSFPCSKNHSRRSFFFF